MFESYLVLGRHIGEASDAFVASGGLDEFGLFQGWHGDPSPENGSDDGQDTGATSDPNTSPTGTAEKSADDESSLVQQTKPVERERVAETAALSDHQKVATQLAEAKFDEVGIDQANKILKGWCNSKLIPENRSGRPIDTSNLEAISKLARNNAARIN